MTDCTHSSLSIFFYCLTFQFNENITDVNASIEICFLYSVRHLKKNLSLFVRIICICLFVRLNLDESFCVDICK